MTDVDSQTRQRTAVAGEPGLGYHRALDGVRGVALISIMAYHGGVALAPGGFLGVDMFFVLSGFLITSLLLAEWDRAGRLDLRRFWTRRARRLLPALFVVVAACLIVSIFVAGRQGETIRGDAVATTFYSSNWWFIAQGSSYFDQFAEPSPLRHSWTLAIEEQWYLLLPILLIVILAWLRLRRWLAPAFLGGALVSAWWMARLAPTADEDPSRAYYGTDTRIQALLIGAGLAAFLTPGVLDRLRPVSRGIGTAAAVLVGAALLLVSDRANWMYSGGFWVFAVAVAAVLLEVLAHPQGVLGRCLGWGPLVWLGKISYGAYLWHWPVYLILTPDRVGVSGPSLLALRVAVTLVIATLSSRYLEMPIRQGALGRLSAGRRRGVLIGAVAAFAVLVIAAFGMARPAEPDDLEAIADSVASIPTELPAGTGPGVGTGAVTAADPQTAGSSAAGSTTRRAVLLGDSNAVSLYASYNPALVPGLSVAPATEFGCGVAPFDSAIDGEKMSIPQKCRTWVQVNRERQLIAAQANVGVLFAGSWEQYDRWVDGSAVAFTEPRWRELTERGYAELLVALRQHTPTVVLVLDGCHRVPDLGLPTSVSFRDGRYPAVVNSGERIRAVNAAARSAAASVGFPVRVIDVNDLLCADGYRDTMNGVQLRTDGLHYTKPGAAVVWRWLGPQLLE